VGFHLTDDVLTIDVTHAPLEQDQWYAVEEQANAMIYADLPVVAQFMTEVEVSKLPLRRPPVVTGPIRVVRVDDLDYSPCGGTHCRSTGSVGLILIRKIERRGTETRVDFVCGRRALADYRSKNRLVSEVSNQLSVGEWELPNAVSRAQDEIKSCHRQLKRAEDRLLEYEAGELLSQAKPVADVRLVRAILDDRDAASAKHLAIRLMSDPRCVALLALVQGSSVQLTFARSDDLTVDMRPLLQDACRIVGGGGGGQPNMAQGGGARVDQIDSALDSAVKALSEMLAD
jgi:alanyl-tRNA synthetase